MKHTIKITTTKILSLLCCLVLFTGCDKDVNYPPRKVTLNSPVNESNDNALDVILSWNIATDPEGSAVTYDVYFGTDATPTSKANSTKIGDPYALSLASSTTYYWKVVAKDTDGATSESDVWSFTTLNAAPSAVTLTAPVDAAIDIATNYTLSWNAATDPEGGEVKYDVYFGTDVTPTSKASSAQTGTTFSPTLAGNTTYYWKVFAKDTGGATSESATWSFTTFNGEPSIVTLTAPADLARYIDVGAILSWETATDPEGSHVTYDVYLGTNATPISKVSSSQTVTKYATTLAGNTTYYWKIVAKDTDGAASESALWSFTTEIIYGSVTDIDGNVYKTVIIGTQEWMAENLKVTKAANGKAINLITDNSAWSTLSNTDAAYCYYNNDTNGEADTYGALYTYAAVVNACPKGWHLPSTDEWTTLERYLAANGHAYNGVIDSDPSSNTFRQKIGKSMADTTGWLTSTAIGSIGNDMSANNTSGFSGLPSGRRLDYNGAFSNGGRVGNWWSSTDYSFNNNSVWTRRLSSEYVYVGYDYTIKSYGLAARCVRD